MNIHAFLWSSFWLSVFVKWKGDKVAANFVADYVRRYPSLRGLYLFINLYISSVEGRAKEDLHILQNLMKKILTEQARLSMRLLVDFPANPCIGNAQAVSSGATIMPIHSLDRRDSSSCHDTVDFCCSYDGLHRSSRSLFFAINCARCVALY